MRQQNTDKTQQQTVSQKILANQAGVGLIELMTSLLLSSVLLLGVTKSTVLTYKNYLNAKQDYYSNILAEKKLAEIGAEDISNITSDSEVTENEVIYAGFSFKRTVNYVVTSSRARVVTVTVTSNKNSSNSAESASATFLPSGVI